MSGAALVRANSVALPLLPDSVDLIVTSPPYFALRSYEDEGEHYAGQIGSEPTPTEFLLALWAVMDECFRVLKPSGSVFVNLGDKMAGSGGHNNSGISTTGSTLEGKKQQDRGGRAAVAASRRRAPDRYNQHADGARDKSLHGLPWRFAMGCYLPHLYRAPFERPTADPDYPDSVVGWAERERGILRSEIIWDDPTADGSELVWSKPNGMPESVIDRVRRSHEQWFHFTKAETYFADIDPLRLGPSGYSRPNTYDAPEIPGQAKRAMTHSENPKGRLPGSVWTIPTEPLHIPDELNVEHFAAFPQEWPRRLILGWCPPDGVVLDPFGGTGTTAMVARALGRFGVSVDLSTSYLRLAGWRIFESGHAVKAIDRTKRESQLALFDIDTAITA